MLPKYAEYTLYIYQQKQYWKEESLPDALPGTQENKQVPFLRNSMDVPITLSLYPKSLTAIWANWYLMLILYKLENELALWVITCERDGHL